MKCNKPLIFFLLFSFAFLTVNADTMGLLTGKVIAEASGSPVVGATVRLTQDGSVKAGAFTNTEGQFRVQIEEGEYLMLVSLESFRTDTTLISIAAGQETSKDVFLKDITLDVVQVTATRSSNTEASQITSKLRQVSTMDAVSSELISRTGANNAASALLRVTGVTVEGGKYVYVRGLGDRYSTTALNGALIPSLDPNRNTVQMDIFPSAMIASLNVFKTFTPDLPGNFSGGFVNVLTKDVPDQFMLNVSASTGYNPQANLNDQFLTYNTGSKDWLGMDDGTRALPEYVKNLEGTIPDRSFSNLEAAQTIDAASKSFNKNWTPSYGRSSLNQNYQISLGNRHDFGSKSSIGYLAGISYRRGYQAYEGNIGRYKNTGREATSLNTEREHSVVDGRQSTLWGALASVSYRYDNRQTLNLTYMHNQSGISRASMFEGPIPFDAPDLIFQTRVLGYLERSLDVLQLKGNFQIGPATLNFISSASQSMQEEPDLRFFSNDFTIEGEGRRYDLQENLYAAPNRFYRDLAEDNWDNRLDLEMPFDLSNGQSLRMKVGGAYTYKARSFNEDRYALISGNIGQNYQGDPAAFFADENMGIRQDTVFGWPQTNYLNFIADVSEDRNDYTASMMIPAAYAMAVIPVSQRLEITAGARYEGTFAETISADSSLDAGMLNNHDILPALNIKYSINNDETLSRMNIRLGASRTLARPSFREFAPFSSFDFVGDYLLRGNPNLQRTLIENYDFRWEWAPQPSELISVSVFYKNFQNPIEKVLVPISAGNAPELTFKNVNQGMAYGTEIEIRKNLGFITEALSDFQISTNVSLLKSEVSIDSAELAAIRAVDPERPATRPIYGQSPYTGNAELAYLNDTLGLQISLSYNVFGPRIVVVGGKSAPDVYEQPRGLLNLSVAKKFRLGDNDFQIRFRANNLLDPAYKQTHTFKGQEYIFQSYNIGRSYSLGISYSIK